LQGVSVEVPRGSITVLLGRNGAGKTTTLRSIMGLNPPRSGSVRFDGQPLKGLRAHQIAQRGIGYVPEKRVIFRDLTVAQNLQIAERQKGDLERKAGFIFGLFPDLKRLIDLPGGHLSGGQQQMLAIARALVPDNTLLLIDEPSEGLAPVLIEQMMAPFTRFRRARPCAGRAELPSASRLAERYVNHRGRRHGAQRAHGGPVSGR